MESSDFSEKFMYGLRLAIKRLIEKEALVNGSLIISDKEGNIQEVPAKQLLNNYKTENNWMNEEDVIDV